jgi:hypothetical protein
MQAARGVRSPLAAQSSSLPRGLCFKPAQRTPRLAAPRALSSAIGGGGAWKEAAGMVLPLGSSQHTRAEAPAAAADAMSLPATPPGERRGAPAAAPTQNGATRRVLTAPRAGAAARRGGRAVQAARQVPRPGLLHLELLPVAAALRDHARHGAHRDGGRQDQVRAPALAPAALGLAVERWRRPPPGPRSCGCWRSAGTGKQRAACRREQAATGAGSWWAAAGAGAQQAARPSQAAAGGSRGDAWRPAAAAAGGRRSTLSTTSGRRSAQGLSTPSR